MSSDPKLNEAREKLRAEIMPAAWRDLKPHSDRGSVFLVATELDLAEVAHLIVTDDVPAITALIQGAKVVRPTESQLKSWDTAEGARTFHFIIVQPYVLIQDLGH